MMTEDDGTAPEGYRFRAELWWWEARESGSWVFLTVPEDASADLRDRAETVPPVGFGSIRVEVTLGGTTWRTSVFPDRGRTRYVLPVKRAVRRAEGVEVGDLVEVALVPLVG